MDQNEKPLYHALINHINKKPISFHVPGHKNGAIFQEAYFSELLKLDVTELIGLDDLHSPEGPILEAEALLAQLYHVKKSFFLVNGSTVGNLAMVMAACRENDVVLVQRNCHKSILNAISLAGVQPVFLEPEYNRDWRIAAGVHPDTVEAAIAQFPQAKALIVTYPNYYGMAYHLQQMIEAAHRQQMPVLVDEAHGPHWILGEPFPPSAVQLGADIAVQSAHKTLPAMTMGSFLHFNSVHVDLKRIMDFLHILQTSSPSYPIMASLDLARNYLASYEQKDINYLLHEISKFKKSLHHIPGIRVLEYESKGDPLKITIQSTGDQSGFAIQGKLEKLGVFTELADPRNVLFMLPLLKENQSYPFDEALGKIKAALKDASSQPEPKQQAVPSSNEKISALAIPYKEMDTLPVTNIPVSEASGRIAAETVIPYPPGIPLLLRGEKITRERVEMLRELADAGARFQGGALLAQNKLKVFCTR